MMTSEDLKKIPVFAGVEEPERQRLARLAADISIEPGDWLLREGEEPRFFVILEASSPCSKTSSVRAMSCATPPPGIFPANSRLSRYRPHRFPPRPHTLPRRSFEPQQLQELVRHSPSAAELIFQTMSSRTGVAQQIVRETPSSRVEISGPTFDTGSAPSVLPFRQPHPDDWSPTHPESGPESAITVAVDGSPPENPHRPPCRRSSRLPDRPQTQSIRSPHRGRWSHRHGRRRLRRFRRSRPWSSNVSPPAARPAPPRASKITSAFPPASPGTNSPSAPSSKPATSASRSLSSATSKKLARSTAAFASHSTAVTASVRALPSSADRRLLVSSFLRLSPPVPRPRHSLRRIQLRWHLRHRPSLFLVGGGNSAGQAAIFYSAYASEVILLVGGSGLAQSMSQYLIQQIQEKANIRVQPLTQVTRAHGNDCLNRSRRSNVCEGAASTQIVDATALFIMIGAVAKTEWLPPENPARRQRFHPYRL